MAFKSKGGKYFFKENYNQKVEKYKIPVLPGMAQAKFKLALGFKPFPRISVLVRADSLLSWHLSTWSSRTRNSGRLYHKQTLF